MSPSLIARAVSAALGRPLIRLFPELLVLVGAPRARRLGRSNQVCDRASGRAGERRTCWLAAGSELTGRLSIKLGRLGAARALEPRLGAHNAHKIIMDRALRQVGVGAGSAALTISCQRRERALIFQSASRDE